MPGQTVTLLEFVLALLPIAAVLVLMVAFRWGGDRAGALGWLVAVAVAASFFGAGPRLLAYAQARAVLLTLFVLYIIWMALLLYNVVNEAGAIAVIASHLVRLTGDRVLQLLVLSWVFSSFLQGVSGFGVPVAVVAPLLIGMGFSPVTSVTAAAVGHSWSVSFGSVATAFNTLIAASGLPGETLAPWSAILLGVACFGCGIAAAHAYEGTASLKRGWPALLLVGAVMAATQYLLAVNHLWNLAGFAAGLAGLGASAAVARLPFYRATPVTGPTTRPSMPLPLAVSPYLVLVGLVMAAQFVAPINAALNRVALVMTFPEMQTARGWVTAASPGRAISLFGHAGALLAYTATIAYTSFHLTGRYRPGALKGILANTARSAVRSSLGIATMVGMATVMEQSGMTFALAEALSQTMRPVYPLLAAFIGLLGAFMTGSNNNSNVVFTGLQQQAAYLLDLPVTIILAAQTAGGALGGMLAPAKIIVGASTTGLSGQEGRVLQRTAVYGLAITLVIGGVAWLAASGS